MVWRVAGINFDHMHMGDLLRLVHEHPEAEIAGVYDPDPEADGGGRARVRDPARSGCSPISTPAWRR